MKELDTTHAYFTMKEGIIICKFKMRELTLDIAKEIVTSRKAFAESKSYPAIVNIEGVKVATKEARDYFNSAESYEGIPAGALILKSTFAANLANFFLKIASPKIPNKVFTSEEKAIEWLKQFRKE